MTSGTSTGIKTTAKRTFHRFGSPPWLFRFCGWLIPWLWAAFIGLSAWGLWWAFVKAPPDYLQGESVRIMYIHVPSAWMSMWLYLVLAGWSAIGLIFNTRLSFMMAQATAPTGASWSRSPTPGSDCVA